MRLILLAFACFAAAFAFAFRDRLGLAPASADVVIRDGAMAHPVRVFPEPLPVAGLRVESPRGTVALDGFGGEVVIVTAWATWCGVCREELPALRALAAAAPVQVLPVSVERNDSLAGIEAYLRRNRLATLPALSDARGDVARLAEVKGVPTSLVIDRFGQVVARFHGRAPWQAKAVRDWLGALAAAETPAASRALWRDFAR